MRFKALVFQTKKCDRRILTESDRIHLQIYNHGNSLGLAIVKRVVEAHGGELQIESSPQIGTQVTVQIPL